MASRVSIEVTLFPRITCKEHQSEGSIDEKRDLTYNRPNGVLLSRGGLLDGVVNDKVQEDIISAQGSADFASTLEMDEQLFVHELPISSVLSL